MPLDPQQAAQELLNRRQARKDFASWCRLCGFEPAKHHLLVIEKLQKAVDLYKTQGKGSKIMFMLPPGTGKSTYTSKCFPEWFLAQMSNLAILACSHSADLAVDFGRAARNLVETHSKVLGYELSKDSRAADSWEITNGGYYRAAGCGAGIAGRRADLGLIDDFCGTEEDARSKTFNDKIWNWWLNDFVPRLKPNAIRIIMCNHRNEDDLVGRLLAKEANEWEVVRLRLLIEDEEQAESDPLGRKVGEHIWPEYFNREMVSERMKNPSSSGIEQQEPSPQDGDFFKAEWFKEYETLPLISELRYYCASDHAVSEKQTADKTCIIPAAFSNGKLYILPDVIWSRLAAKEQVDAMLKIARTIKPLLWWAEKGHISKSLLPFLQDRMMDERVYANIIQVTPSKDKLTRAQSIQGMMSMGLVYWPKNAKWYQQARREMLMFPNGKHDDFVDALAHLGRGISQMSSPRSVRPVVEIDVNASNGFNITPKTIKESDKRKKRLMSAALIDR